MLALFDNPPLIHHNNEVGIIAAANPHCPQVGHKMGPVGPFKVLRIHFLS